MLVPFEQIEVFDRHRPAVVVFVEQVASEMRRTVALVVEGQGGRSPSALLAIAAGIAAAVIVSAAAASATDTSGAAGAAAAARDERKGKGAENTQELEPS